MKAKFVYESISFERGKDPKEVMGIGLLNVVREDLKKLGLTREGSITLQNSYSNDIGTQYQWDDETWANHAELDLFTNGFPPELSVTNSEEQYVDMSGSEEIMEYVMKGKLAKFINLE